MARPSWPGKPSSASCWGGDLSAQGERPAHCSQHIYLSTVRRLQKSRAVKHVSPTEGFQARAGQSQGGRRTADSSQQPREGERGRGGRGCPGRTERRLSAPGCLWALALRTSPLADRAEVPLDRYLFPHLHPANSFRSDLHCAQPPLLSPSRNHHQTPPPFAVYPPLPALAQTSPAWTSAVTPIWPSASAPRVSSTGGQRIYLNVV